MITDTLLTLTILGSAFIAYVTVCSIREAHRERRQRAYAADLWTLRAMLRAPIEHSK